MSLTLGMGPREEVDLENGSQTLYEWSKSPENHNFVLRNRRSSEAGCNQKKTFPCWCGKAFQRHALLLRHNTTHTGEKAFKCDVCLAVFTRKDSLMRHMKQHVTSQN